MRMTSKEFLDWPNKAITLLGMSGVGKTTLANHLPKGDWFHYSGDYRIGTKYLQEPILDNVKRKAMQIEFLRDLLRSDSIYIGSNITVNNLEPISTFLGKVGDPLKGGLPLEEFLRRQRLHRDAEIQAMKDVVDFILKAQDIYGYSHFVNDAGGSVCELDDARAMEVLVDNTVLLYLKPDDDMEQELVRRAISNPKPLYYREEFFISRLARYLSQEGLDGPEQMDPDKFVQWIFPELIAHRKPRYEAIAAAHGYTVDATQIGLLRDQRDFMDLITGAMDRN